MRADPNQDSAGVVQLRDDLPGHTKFGRRAAPEQVTRSRGDNGEIRMEVEDLVRYPGGIEAIQLTVDNQDFMSRSLQQRLGITVFERQMRIAATEIDAARKRPRRVHQRKS